MRDFLFFIVDIAIECFQNIKCKFFNLFHDFDEKNVIVRDIINNNYENAIIHIMKCNDISKQLSKIQFIMFIFHIFKI